jgi:hypothetical protein
MLPEEFNALNSGTPFEYSKLQEEFKKACPDFDKILTDATKSIALEFASLMLFVVGPKTRSFKKGSNDGKWRFRMVNGDSFYAVYVSTYKNAPPAAAQPILAGNQLMLTIKQGSLLALDTLSKLIPIALGNNLTVLTPLAGSVFSKDNIKGLSEKTGQDAGYVLTAINQSAQSGGFYLPFSSAAIALVCAISATKNADQKVRDSIITKTVKQYHSKGKIMDWREYDNYSYYAHGGVPSGMTPKELMVRFEGCQEASFRDFKAAQDKMIAETKKNAEEPGTSKN